MIGKSISIPQESLVSIVIWVGIEMDSRVNSDNIALRCDQARINWYQPQDLNEFELNEFRCHSVIHQSQVFFKNYLLIRSASQIKLRTRYKKIYVLTIDLR